MKNNQPHVSIIMPVLNEVGFLERAVQTLSNGGYPAQNLEFILVDGGSTDGTLELIDRLAGEGLNIRLLVNEMRITPYALNIGIQAAKHEIILRADAHAVYQENYISRSVELLQLGAGDNIGGTVISLKGDTPFSELLAHVLNSRLGNGGAGYRRSTKGRLVDTVWCGCWYKSTLQKVGMFDVDWVNNQDAELNARLIAKGFRVFSDPTIRAYLIVRPTFSSFIRQYFRYGKGRFRTLYKHPHILRFRQILPLFAAIIFFVGLFIEPLLLLFLMTLLTAIVFIAFRCKDDFCQLPIYLQFLVFPTVVAMNLSWAAGLTYQFLHHLTLGNRVSN